MRIFLTGASGFLGREVVARLLDRGDEVWALVRDARRCPKGAKPLVGDITHPTLRNIPVTPVDEVWHLAGLMHLGPGHREKLSTVNVDGTLNVMNYAQNAGAKRFVLASTAYVEGKSRNDYELSKKCAERYARDRAEMGAFALTLFRPSILVASTRTLETPRGQGFYRFVVVMARLHRRAEKLRRAVEGAARLPGLHPVFRVRGDPTASLNLVPVDLVAEAMVATAEAGTYHLTNPFPPRLRQLSRWVGEALLLDTRVLRRFRMTPVEALFDRVMAPFLVYLQEEIPLPPSDLKVQTAPVGREFVLETVRNTLGSD